MSGYGRETPDQWTADDLDRAHAAQDYEAIRAAKESGALRDLMAGTAQTTTED